MNTRTLAILAAIGATTIYGINHTIAKGVMPTYVKPFGFIMLRLVGATLLFWAVSFFVPKEIIEKKDWGRVLICAITGMGINMLSFFKGLALSTPINSSVLITVSPILVVSLSALLIKEKITLQKGIGITLGFIGAVTLILFGAEIRQDAPNIPLGNLLFIVNAVSYGIYLILVKKLLNKYHPFTLMKWLFLIGTILCSPITVPEFLEVKWATMPKSAVGGVVFVIVCTTFLTYLFNIFALTKLKASTVSSFVYLQPIIGILFAVLAGKDHIDTLKIVATLLIMLGVYLVSKKPIPNP
ncbi:drug/metabolite transporter (DMT)-like permease [Maribacter vaceletii]|uniref:Drug/metabolite transporter (DMT)-like permease n=1 Tax=Maribacter vaceletii TaxID=1206816 RepID=A0A495EEM3_9FLAO|nr:DMT family transporter [Maribacter vaceletii]RKR14993.1 drug/metabolite transporter (DMT)-like permease [Maribacter vaceletii]